MNTFILTSLTFLIIATNLKGQWEILNEGVNGVVNSIDFVNENVGWIACLHSILKTEDGGETWKSIYLDDQLRIYHIDFYNEFIGWGIGLHGDDIWFEGEEIVGYESVMILKTLDGGQNWTIQKQSEGWPYLLFALNDTIVFFGGRDDGILKTSDGGINWIDITPNDSTIGFSSLWFSNPNFGIITGDNDDYDNGIVLKTYDGGETWDSKIVPEFNEIGGPQFLNDSTAYFLATYENTVEWHTEYFLCKTIDTLSSWTVKYKTAHNPAIISYHALDNDTIVAIMENESTYVMKSTDGGIIWEKKQVIWPWSVFWRNRNINLYFNKNDVGFLLDGTFYESNIYKSTDQGDTWAIQNFSYALNDVFFISEKIGIAGRGLIITWGGEGSRNSIRELNYY